MGLPSVGKATGEYVKICDVRPVTGCVVETIQCRDYQSHHSQHGSAELL